MADYQVMPPLSEEEYRELKSDIAQRGVMVPIEFDEDGNVLDGHHRLRACEELGIKDYPKVIRAGMSEAEKMTHARKLNMARRHLTREQRNDLIRQQKKEHPEWSNLKIAKELGVSDKTVGTVVEEMEAVGEIKSTDDRIYQAKAEHPDWSDRRIAREVGVSQPTVSARRKEAEKPSDKNSEFPNFYHSEESHKPVTVFNPTPREQRALRDERVVERMKETGSKSPVSTKHKIRAEEKAERKSYELEEEIPDGAVKLFKADIKDGLPEIEDDSIDFIITDPPYPKDYINLHVDLAIMAARVLKPGGSLLVMCGQSYFPMVCSILDSAPGLEYYWLCAYMTPGGQSPSLWSKKVNTFWKPVLWFVKGAYGGEYIGDVVKTLPNDNDKSCHEWGQSVYGMRCLIEKITNPGDLILDPFVGGGATGVAAILSGRRFIGTDIEQSCVSASEARIKEEYRNARSAEGKNRLEG